jgi:hypothetical protein
VLPVPLLWVPLDVPLVVLAPSAALVDVSVASAVSVVFSRGPVCFSAAAVAVVVTVVVTVVVVTVITESIVFVSVVVVVVVLVSVLAILCQLALLFVSAMRSATKSVRFFLSAAHVMCRGFPV